MTGPTVVQAAVAGGGRPVPTVTFGANVTAGNTLIAAVFAAANNMVPAFPVAGSNGWTLHDNDTHAGAGNVAWYSRTAIVGDNTSPPSPPNSSDYNTFGVSIAMWEVNGSAGIDASNAHATASTGLSPSTGITTGVANTLALFAVQEFFCTALAITGGAPGSWTQDAAASNIGADGTERIIASHQAVASSGATVDATVTSTSTDASLAYATITLKGPNESGTAALALSGVGFGAHGEVDDATATATLVLSGVALRVIAVDPSAETTLVSFYVF